MRKIIAGIMILGAGLGFSSCNDFLDMTPTDRISDKMIWSSVENAEYAVNYLYSYVYDVYANQSLAGKTDAFTDQFKYGSYNYNSLCFIPSEVAYGGATLTNSYVDTYLGTWSDNYTRIRKVNEAISNLKSYGEMSAADATRLEAELRFLRAYLYFDLVKRYKNIIIYDEDLTQIVKDKDVSEESKAWDFIQQDLDFASTELPDKASANGRLDKGMAYAFITRAMLYAGRYDAVITAADKVAELGYDLEDNYADVFSKTIAEGNKEAILQYQFSLANNVTHQFDFYYTPGGDYNLISSTGGGYGTPTQEMVESYEYAAGGFPDWTPWHTDEGTTATPPYEELEPRFHASILYNGASWKGRTIESFVNGLDGWCEWNLEKEPKGRSTTGYYLRKMVDETHDLTVRTASIQPFNIIRYGEVLLNKAEACYMTNDNAGANEAVKKIRGRVSLPWSDKSGEALFSAIKQERKVELAFEELWYWDLRRWGDADKDYPQGLNNYQVHGLKIEATAVPGEYLYTYISVDDKDRNFPSKMYRFPVPESELSSNGIINQYPEWN